MPPLLAITLCLACGLQPQPPAAPPVRRDGSDQRTVMTPDTLAAQVRAHTSDSINTAQQLGPAAAPVLTPLARDQDRGTRLQALRCFDAIGGPEAIDAALNALTDEDSQVAARATVLLHHHPPKGREMELLNAFTRSDDPFVRAELPKIAGRVPTDATTKVWVARLVVEEDPTVRQGMQIGLARMGHEPSRTWFKAQLAAVNGPPALEWLEAAEYMQATWVVPTLARLLDNVSVVYTSSPDHKPLPIRVCDLAAYAILTLTATPTDFPLRKTRFTETQIDAARAAAAKVSTPP